MVTTRCTYFLADAYASSVPVWSHGRCREQRSRRTANTPCWTATHSPPFLRPLPSTTPGRRECRRRSGASPCSAPRRSSSRFHQAGPFARQSTSGPPIDPIMGAVRGPRIRVARVAWMMRLVVWPAGVSIAFGSVAPVEERGRYGFGVRRPGQPSATSIGRYGGRRMVRDSSRMPFMGETDANTSSNERGSFLARRRFRAARVGRE